MNQPLSDIELDRLAEFLNAIGPPTSNLESLDGYFAALICGPEMVLPSEYLSEIWGEEYSFDSNAQATDILGLIMRHWNTIATALQDTVDKPDVYLPILLEDANGITHGSDWAQGFMRGVSARPGSWAELIESEEHGGLLVPMMCFAHEHDPDPAIRPAPILPEKRERLLQIMIASLTQIYRYFEPQRRSQAQAQIPLRRTVPKIGRNDPCPCGSGKKYKHCCAANGPMMH